MARLLARLGLEIGTGSQILDIRLAVERGQMSNQKLNVVSVDCPYCDGENVIARVKSRLSEPDLTDHEIACKYCRSLFTLSESRPRIRRLSKQELDVA